jgi:hypothetical protein
VVEITVVAGGWEKKTLMKYVQSCSFFTQLEQHKGTTIKKKFVHANNTELKAAGPGPFRAQLQPLIFSWLIQCIPL